MDASVSMEMEGPGKWNCERVRSGQIWDLFWEQSRRDFLMDGWGKLRKGKN